MFIGLILVAIGVISLLIKLDVLSGNLWGYLWPIILIGIGLRFLIGRRWGWRRHSGGGWSACCGLGSEEEERAKRERP